MTKKLKIEEGTARKLYSTAAPELRSILEESFGKDFFSMKILDRINLFQDVLDERRLTIGEVIPYTSPKNKNQRSLNATAKLQVVSEVLNEDWTADFNNQSQPKYYPIFKKTSSGWTVDCSTLSTSVRSWGRAFTIEMQRQLYMQATSSWTSTLIFFLN